MYSIIPEPFRTLCLLILILIGALLAVSFVTNAYSQERHGRLPKKTELPQTALLIVFALIVWLTTARGTAFSAFGALVCLGIAAGFVGDLFMANVFRQSDVLHVLCGMAAFAVGHILYMLGFREIALQFNLLDLSRYALALGITWILAGVFWFLLVRQPDGDSLQYAALGYALFLASMAGYALGLAMQNGVFIPLALGAIIFLISDTLIAAQLFAKRTFRYMGDTIWITYIVAQVLIVTITIAALSV